MSAVIAASVALLVFAVTQFLTRRREQTQFLLPKLEALYLLLNEVAERNVRTFKLVALAVDGVTSARDQLFTEDENTVYGHTTAKRIIMYIRLYFPDLSGVHQRLFAAEGCVNNLVFDVLAGKQVNKDDLADAFGRTAHLLRLMENEIIANRDRLLRDYLTFRRYRKTPEPDFDTPNPPPDVPMFARDVRGEMNPR